MVSCTLIGGYRACTSVDPAFRLIRAGARVGAWVRGGLGGGMCGIWECRRECGFV